MKTLIIVSYPDYQESSSYAFLKEACPNTVTWHQIDNLKEVNPQEERALINKHERLIFLFPLLWYQAPANLQSWLTQILPEKDEVDNLNNIKDFGLVVTTGLAEKEFQAGMSQAFSLPEILRPYQILARYFSWTYRPVFNLAQLSYLSEKEKLQKLVDYQYYLTGHSFQMRDRTQWLVNQLEARRSHWPEQGTLIDLLQTNLIDKQENIDELFYLSRHD